MFLLLHQIQSIFKLLIHAGYQFDPPMNYPITLPPHHFPRTTTPGGRGGGGATDSSVAPGYKRPIAPPKTNPQMCPIPPNMLKNFVKPEPVSYKNIVYYYTRGTTSTVNHPFDLFLQMPHLCLRLLICSCSFQDKYQV